MGERDSGMAAGGGQLATKYCCGRVAKARTLSCSLVRSSAGAGGKPACRLGPKGVFSLGQERAGRPLSGWAIIAACLPCLPWMK